MTTNPDRFNLERFVEAQGPVYQTALTELRAGRKRTHWMWFIFPQLAGLGFSPTAQFYGITSLAEAQAYLSHPQLGPRLLECIAAVSRVEGRTAHQVFGSPDDFKFRSCFTLFAQATADNQVFLEALAKYYHGAPDEQTLALLGLS